jgi:hypothetical protein
MTTDVNCDHNIILLALSKKNYPTSDEDLAFLDSHVQNDINNSNKSVLHTHFE